MTPRGRPRHLVAPMCAALLAACGIGGPNTPEPSPSGSVGAAISADAVAHLVLTDLQADYYYDMNQSTWKTMRQTATSLPWHMVSAAGVVQAAACIGEGAPTVVYINGFGAPAVESWSLTAKQQSRGDRVCLFDRPGLGLSPARAGAAPHSSPEKHATEMLDMLAVLGEPGPYLLVAHSYGGLVARSAAAQHPDAVAGMVLVDATSPLQPGLGEPWNGEQGFIDTDTIASTVGSGPDMGDRPVIVLEAGQPEEDAPDGVQKTWSDLQSQAATISANSVHAIVNDSDHSIPMRNPAAVVAATTAVAESIRAANAALPTCPKDLAAAEVTCKDT
jgi:hypothetical protein